MRKIFFLFCMSLVLFASTLFSQTTGNFNYQAVVRDTEGNLLTNKSMSVQLSIIESTADGDEIYVETHAVTSTNTGIINLLVGDGTSSLGNFETINWGENAKFIKIEINAGNSLVNMGTFQLFSVPFAHYAIEVENKDDADADPANEIQDISLVGTDLSITSGSTVDLSVIQDGVDDADSDPSNEIQDLYLSGDDVLTITNNPSPTSINLSAYTGTNTDEQELSILGDTLYISNGNEVVLPYDSSKWVINGNNMYYNGGNVGIGSSTPVSNLEVKGTAVTSDALFQVINSNNDTVFAVYPDGVKIFIDSEAKGKVGGFAISGRSPSKAGGVEIFRATVDSTRIYVSDTVSSKGKVGGFAISGRSPSKGVGNDYLLITGDSTRIYINDTLATKGKVGGFAISGRSPSKGPTNDYLQINRDSTRIYITESATKGKVGGFAISGRSPSKAGYTEKDYFNISANTTAEKINNESRIMWYPEKSAFMGGEVHVGSADSVGTNSTALGYRNIAYGNWSQAFGFQSRAMGLYSTAIGNEAEAEDNSLAVGYQAKATGISSYALGSGALATADKSFAFGSVGIDSAGVVTGNTKAIGDYAYAFGLGSISSGRGSFAMGANDTASGNFSTAMGYKTKAESWYATSMGGYTKATDHYATALGYRSEATNVAAFASGYFAKASGDNSIAIGYATEAIGTSSVAIGGATKAQGHYSFAANESTISIGFGATSFGNLTGANGDYSFASGYQTISGGQFSFVGGDGSSSSGKTSVSFGTDNTSSGEASLSMGESNTASGKYSVALGIGNTSSSYACVSIGEYNLDPGGNATSWSAGDPLFIAGNGFPPPFTTHTNAMVLYKNGNMTIAGTLTENSDIRLKENIVKLENVLPNVLKINPVYFEFKNKNSHPAGRHIGFIAQDIEPLFPELVEKDSEGYLSVEYANITAILLQAIKEQQELINKQQNENIKLQNQILEMNGKLEKLEKTLLNK